MSRIRTATGTVILAAGLCLVMAVAAEAAELPATNAVRKLAPTQMADASVITNAGETGHGNATLNSYHSDATTTYQPVFVFVLPDLGGASIASANLACYGVKVNANDTYFTAGDLYAVIHQAETGNNSDTEVDTPTHKSVSNEYSVAGNNGTGIMDDFFPPSTTGAAEGLHETDAAADTALGNWLQTQYDGGAVAGDYVFLRIQPDRQIGTVYSRGWTIDTADHGTPAQRPALTITTEDAAKGFEIISK